MSLYGVVYAIIENDVRRLFAYHIVSQVGYMVAGVGIGTALAINGAWPTPSRTSFTRAFSSWAAAPSCS